MRRYRKSGFTDGHLSESRWSVPRRYPFARIPSPGSADRYGGAAIAAGWNPPRAPPFSPVGPGRVCPCPGPGAGTRGGFLEVTGVSRRGGGAAREGKPLFFFVGV